MSASGNSIEFRLRGLERQLRFQRSVIALLGVALVALLGLGATRPAPEVIRAQRFEAVNSRGGVAAVMAAFRGHGDGVFRAYNMSGKEVFYAGSTGGGHGKVEVKTNRGQIKLEFSGKK